MDKVNKVADYLTESLKSIPLIKQIRGIGTMIGFSLPDHETQLRVMSYLHENGVIVNAAGPTRIGINPTLIFEKKHADEFLSVLKKALKSLDKE